jgi:hypothetical protein
MGSKNLDRVSVGEWSNKCETVADFMRDGIEVISSCEKCELKVLAALRLAALGALAVAYGGGSAGG